MDNRFDEIFVFIRVVEANSFSAAARQLFRSPSTISKTIARLEDRLGSRLFDRSTRTLALTPEGHLLYERGVKVLREIDEMESALSSESSSARGTVRVSSSLPFGTYAIEPLLPEFWRCHPRISVDLSLSDEIIDLYLDHTDIAFRVGPLADSSLTARKIGTTTRRMIAAPSYLAEHGTPENLFDLQQHQCLSFNFRRAQPVWRLRDGARLVEQEIQGNLLANNGETVRRLAVAGAGIARLADFHIFRDLDAGRLVEVLPDCGRDSEDVHALFVGGDLIPQRVRVFLDFMVPRLRSFMAASTPEIA